MAELAVLAEEVGWDGFFVWDKLRASQHALHVDAQKRRLQYRLPEILAHWLVTQRRTEGDGRRGDQRVNARHSSLEWVLNESRPSPRPGSAIT
jgi:alkanesulfonate monooxygenase SsuD/methylene tetrahydromethanopterin reductase-like flavin-dependent oxidoreductase (luciferase family)